MTFPAFGVITGVVSEDSAVKVSGRVACIDRDTLQIVDVVKTDAYGTYRFEFLDTSKQYLVLALDDNTVSTTSGDSAPPSARYVRILIGSAGTDSTSKGFAEVELASTAAGADITTSSTPVTTQYHTNSNTANLVVDNNGSTGWFGSANECAPYVMLDLGSSQTIYEVRIQPHDSSYALAPLELVIQLSDDAVKWDTVYRYAGATAWAAGVKKTFVLNARPGTTTYNSDAKNAVAADYVTPVEGFRDWDTFYRAMVTLAANTANLYFFDHFRMRFASYATYNNNGYVDQLTGSQCYPGAPLRFGIGRTAGALPGLYQPLSPVRNRVKLTSDGYTFESANSHTYSVVVTLPHMDDAVLLGTRTACFSEAGMSRMAQGLYINRRLVMARYLIGGQYTNDYRPVSYIPASPLPESFMVTLVCTGATKLELYIDGTLVTTSTINNGNPSVGGGDHNNELYVAARSGDGKSEPQVWCVGRFPVAFTGAQVSDLHTKRTTVPSIATRTFADTVKALRPMYYFKMDNADPTQVVDQMMGGALVKSSAGTITAAGSGFTPSVGAMAFNGAWVRPSIPVPQGIGSSGFAFMVFMRIAAAPSPTAVPFTWRDSAGNYFGLGQMQIGTDRLITVLGAGGSGVLFEDFVMALNTDYLLVVQVREHVDRGLVFELFANGVLVSSREFHPFDSGVHWVNQNASPDTSRFMFIGAQRTSGNGVTNAFVGDIGHTAYFNKPLTADEIATLYAARTL